MNGTYKDILRNRRVFYKSFVEYGLEESLLSSGIKGIMMSTCDEGGPQQDKPTTTALINNSYSFSKILWLLLRMPERWLMKRPTTIDSVLRNEGVTQSNEILGAPPPPPLFREIKPSNDDCYQLPKGSFGAKPVDFLRQVPQERFTGISGSELIKCN